MNDQQPGIAYLYQTHCRPLIHFAMYFLPNKEEAEDIVQELFYKLCNSCPHFDNFMAARSFLYVSVRNKCYDYCRHQIVEGKYRRLILNQDEPLDELTDVQEGWMQEAEQLSWLLVLIKELPAGDKLIAEAMLEMKSAAVTANELGKDVKSVRNRRAAIKKQLREIVRKDKPPMVYIGFTISCLLCLSLSESILLILTYIIIPPLNH
jgi:RNA polymerase sigma factor (sigma-70 family)